jgi:hypothetical protein
MQSVRLSPRPLPDRNLSSRRAPGGRDGETVAAAGASDESRMVTGQVLPVDSGVTIS